MGAALPQQRENLRTDNRVATLEAAKAELELARLEGVGQAGRPVISGECCCWFAAQPSMKDLGNRCGTRTRAKTSQGNKHSLNRRDIGADFQRISEFRF
jgi:hypothetical protein